MHWYVVLTFDFLKNRSVVQILIGFGTAINSWAKVYKIFKAGLLTLTSGVLLNSNKTIEMTCDFWDFFVIEIKYSITKKNNMQCLKSKYIQMRLRHKNPPFSLYISHLLLSFFKKVNILSYQYLNYEVWRSNFERTHFTYFSNLFLFSDGSGNGPSYFTKKGNRNCWFVLNLRPISIFGCLHNKCPSLLTHSIP